MKRILIAAAALVAALPGLAYQIAKPQAFDKMAESANLVFRGEVIKLAYRDSTGTKDQGPVPHTFVTFKVREVLHGNVSGDTLTLRFLGGRNAAGQVLFVSGQPMFDIGDEDVLFVKGNGTAECPLIGCSNGRIRMINGMAYTDNGKSLRRDANGALTHGRVEELDAVNSFRIGEQLYQRKRGGNRSMDDQDHAPQQQFDRGAHLDAQAFTSDLTERLRARLPQDPFGARKQARSADINRAFVKAPAQPIALKEPARDVLPRARTRAERIEQDALIRNNGNPVIDR